MKEISKKSIILFLIIIATISLGLKLYTVNFTVLPEEDTFGYVLRGMAHNIGDFTEHPRKTLGWSIFISPFFHMTDSCLLYTSPSPRDVEESRMPSSA